MLEETADDDFAVAAGVDIGGVPEIDAEIEGLAEEGRTIGFVERPRLAAGKWFASSGRTVGHAAETDAGDFEAGVAEIEVVHVWLLISV